MYRVEASRMRNLFQRDGELLHSQDRCRELQLLWLERGDKAARDRLFRALMWYALSPRRIIRACLIRRAIREELEGDVALACLRTIELWDPEKGASIWTTVAWQRMGAISRAMTKHPVRYSDNAEAMARSGRVHRPTHAPQFELDEAPWNGDTEAEVFGRQVVGMVPEAARRLGMKRNELAWAVIAGEMKGETMQETADSLGVTRQRVHVVRNRLFGELRIMAEEAA